MDNPTRCGALRKAPVVIRNPRNINEIVFIHPFIDGNGRTTRLGLSYPSDKADIKKGRTLTSAAFCNVGVPKGIRTPVTAVKGPNLLF